MAGLYLNQTLTPKLVVFPATVATFPLFYLRARGSSPCRDGRFGRRITAASLPLSSSYRRRSCSCTCIVSRSSDGLSSIIIDDSGGSGIRQGTRGSDEPLEDGSWMASGTRAMSTKLRLIAAVLLPLQWIGIRLLDIHLPPQWEAIGAGLSIFGAAFILSWAAEVAQADIPQALALAFLALVAVLPEYAVDMYFAWSAGKDPAYITYATANMTGANRLLIGLGWASVF